MHILYPVSSQSRFTVVLAIKDNASVEQTGSALLFNNAMFDMFECVDAGDRRDELCDKICQFILETAALQGRYL